MTDKLHMQVIWVIAQTKPMAWALAVSGKHVYRDKHKAFEDWEKVRYKTEMPYGFNFGDYWSKGKPWRVFRLMFGVTIEEELPP